MSVVCGLHEADEKKENEKCKCGIEVKCVLVAPGLLSSSGIKYVCIYVVQAYVSSTLPLELSKRIFILSVIHRAADKLLHSVCNFFKL